MGIYDDPGDRLVAVTPSDSTDLTGARGFYVGTAGNVAVTALRDSSAVTLISVPAGAVVPIRVKYIMSTNTTASNIVAIY